MKSPFLDTAIFYRPEPFICCQDDGIVLYANQAWRVFCADVF